MLRLKLLITNFLSRFPFFLFSFVSQIVLLDFIEKEGCVFSILVMRYGMCKCASGMCERMFSICACVINI